MDLFGVLSLIGGLALFLYGMQVMSDGLKQVSGGKLEKVLQNLTSSRWKAALLGLAVTSVIQSSSATTVMVVGLVNSGMMQLTQAVGVILGANVGTTVTAWILSLTGIKSENVLIEMFQPANFSPLVAAIGIGLLMFSKKEKKRGIGTILIGFAVLMFGMETMSSSVKPLAEDQQFVSILTMFSNPFLGMLAGLTLTLIIQSSSASIGMLQALSMSGTVKIGIALPVLMGENIGTAITAILASIGTSKNAKRAALMHMYFCLIKTSTFMILFYTINAFVHFSFLDNIANPLTIAIIHSAFNVVSALIMLPISDILVKLAVKTIPITAEETAGSETDRSRRLPKLDPRFYTSPALAIAASRAEAGEMASHAEDALRASLALLDNYSAEGFAGVEHTEQLVDRYDDQLENYLADLSRQVLSISESRELASLQRSVVDIERICDHALNIAQAAAQKDRIGRTLPGKAQDSLAVFSRAVLDIMHVSVEAFRADNSDLAKTVEPLEEVIDDLNIEVKRRIRRMRKGKGNVKTGFLLSDVATDCERVADHCSNIAIAMLQENEQAGGAHEYLDSVKSADNAAFAAEVENYRKKYSLAKLAAEPDEPDDDDGAPTAEEKDRAKEKAKAKVKDKEKEKKKDAK